MEKLNQIEKQILELEEEPYIGTEPRYRVLKRQGYRVLVLEKDLFFTKLMKKIKSSYICGCRWTSGLSEYYTWLIEIVDSY